MSKMMFSLAFLGLLFVGCGSVDVHDNNVTIINQDSFNGNEAIVDAGKTDAEVNGTSVGETKATITEIHNVLVSDLTTTGFTISWDGGSDNCVVFLKSFDEDFFTTESSGNNTYTYTKLAEGSTWEVFVKDNETGKIVKYGGVVTTSVSSNGNNSGLIKVYGGGEHTVEEIRALQREHLETTTYDFIAANHYHTIEKYGDNFFNEMINYNIHKILGDDSYEFHIDHFLNTRGSEASYAGSSIFNFIGEDLFLDVSFLTLDTGSAPAPIPVVKVKLDDIYRVESIYRLHFNANTKTYYRSVLTGVPAGTRKIAYIYYFDGSHYSHQPVAIAYNAL